MWLHTLAMCLTISATVATVLFVVGYAVRSPWRANEIGKNTMLFMSVVAGTLVLTLYYRLTRTIAPIWMATAVWGTLNVPLWWRVWILWKAQHSRYTIQLPPHECQHCGQICNGR